MHKWGNKEVIDLTSVNKGGTSRVMREEGKEDGIFVNSAFPHERKVREGGNKVGKGCSYVCLIINVFSVFAGENVHHLQILIDSIKLNRWAKCSH